MPALTLDGYITCDIFQGSYNTIRFNEFIRLRVLPLCQPGYSVLIINNCKTHQSEELQEMCRATNIELAFLPPYSPDFNPIEQSFHVLKGWIRRHGKLANSDIYKQDFKGFL